MVAIGFGLIALSILGVAALWRPRLLASPWLLRSVHRVGAGPQIANQVGWFTAEVGRQPWIVYGLLRTSDGLSRAVRAEHVLTSLILFTVIYALLFAVFVYLLHQKIVHGPDEPSEAAPARRSIPRLTESH